MDTGLIFAILYARTGSCWKKNSSGIWISSRFSQTISLSASKWRSIFNISRILKFKSRNHSIVLNKKYILEYNFNMIVRLKKFDFVIFHIDLFQQTRMVSDLKTCDASKHRTITELNQTKHRFGILVELTYSKGQAHCEMIRYHRLLSLTGTYLIHLLILIYVLDIGRT